MNPMLINPKIDDNSDVQTQLKQMKSYLFQFKEQVELILSNVDKDNLSETMNTDLDTIRGGIRQYEVKIDGFSSKIAQTANMISAKLSSDDVDAEFIIGRLNDGSTYARIDADRIDVDGVFTANGSFEVAENGDLTFKGAGIDIRTSSSTADCIKMVYATDTNNDGVDDGFMETYIRPGGIRLGYNNPFAFSIEANSLGSFLSMGSDHLALSYNGSANSLQIGDSNYSKITINDSSFSCPITWKKMSAITSNDYILTGA